MLSRGVRRRWGRHNVRSRLRSQLVGPRSPLAGLVHRSTMTIGASRVARRSGNGTVEIDGPARAIARALVTTAFGRHSSEERAWVRRIEGRRRELDRDKATAQPWIPEHARATRDKEEAILPVAIQTLAPWVSLPRVWCLFLMRLIRELEPRSCLELGTGLGVSAAYQAAALELNGMGSLVSLEAASEYVEVARRGVASLGLQQRVDVRLGPIGETLVGALKDGAPIDYAFVDAEHTEEATLTAFDSILPGLSDGAVVVFDDINWPGVSNAWSVISSHPRVGIAVGCRRVGVIVIAAPPT